MLVASREGSTLTYHHQVTTGTTCIVEDSAQVDGIGGVLWDGTLLTNVVLEEMLLSYAMPSSAGPQTLHILELGAGAGLTSLMLHDLAKSSSSLSLRLTATDRCVDLLLQNAAAAGAVDLNIQELEWGNETDISRVLHECGKPDIIIGSEIMVLVKQQPALITTIDRLRHPDTLLLVSADGGLQEGARGRRHEYTASKYEMAFTSALLQLGLASNPVCQGAVRWQGNTATLEGQCLSAPTFLTSLAAAPTARADCKPQERSSEQSGRKQGRPPRPPAADQGDEKCSKLGDCDRLQSSCSPPSLPPAKDAEADHQHWSHHVVLFYPHRAVSTCKRCQAPYLSGYGGIFNPPTACAYHPLSFVCRKHPCEVGLDGGFGDGEGYYGGGQRDFAARFWDCCGSDDPHALGCKRVFHEPY